MLWVNHNGAVGLLGSYQGNATVGGHNWNVYKGTNGSNEVFSQRTPVAVARAAALAPGDRVAQRQDTQGSAGGDGGGQQSLARFTGGHVPHHPVGRLLRNGASRSAITRSS
ncbi:hypothetical protein STSP_37420 [Streptomyces jeddahensis]|uniref:Uncharacterized protein n=1 Tax=Streptomyces jeddahensis TaxID=1716141 RepID=A0A177HQC7_9ACTN|nr:hypothetical protein STSP_37420 [Streptomyces jeddahensis]